MLMGKRMKSKMMIM